MTNRHKSDCYFHCDWCEEESIGVFQVLVPTTYRHHGQTASAYADVMVHPGWYPLISVRTRFNGVPREDIRVELQGTVTSDYYENRLFTERSSHKDENVGKPRGHTIILATWKEGGDFSYGQRACTTEPTDGSRWVDGQHGTESGCREALERWCQKQDIGQYRVELNHN